MVYAVIMHTSTIPTKVLVGLGLGLVGLFVIGTVATWTMNGIGQTGSGNVASTQSETGSAAPMSSPDRGSMAYDSYTTMPYPIPTPGSSSVSPDRQLIRTSYVSLVVDNLRTRTGAFTDEAKNLGGFASSSALTTLSDGTEQATLALRVPADKLDALLSAVRAQALRITGEQTNNDDTTDQLVDLDARLKALRESDDRYADILKQASGADEILKITQARNDLRLQIEQLSAQQENLKNQVAFSTAYLTMNTETGLPSQPAWRPLQQAKLAWQGLLAGLAGTGTVLIVGLITLPLALVWLGLFWLAIRLGWRLVTWLRRRIFHE